MTSSVLKFVIIKAVQGTCLRTNWCELLLLHRSQYLNRDTKERKKVSIDCPVDIGNPPAVIMWYKVNGTCGNKINSSSTLEIQNAALSDEGWYTCFAINELGNTTVILLFLVGKSNS